VGAGEVADIDIASRILVPPTAADRGLQRPCFLLNLRPMPVIAKNLPNSLGAVLVQVLTWDICDAAAERAANKSLRVS